MVKVFAALGGAFAMLSVACGAFGAHALRARLDERALEVWETAASYQMYHGLGLLAVAWILAQTQSTAATVAGWAMVVGVVVFSGSLYTLSLTGIKWLGAITPIGGVAFIVAWIALIVAATGLEG